MSQSYVLQPPQGSLHYTPEHCVVMVVSIFMLVLKSNTFQMVSKWRSFREPCAKRRFPATDFRFGTRPATDGEAQMMAVHFGGAQHRVAVPRVEPVGQPLLAALPFLPPAHRVLALAGLPRKAKKNA